MQRVRIETGGSINGVYYGGGTLLDCDERVAATLVVSGSASYHGADGAARTLELRSTSPLWHDGARVYRTTPSQANVRIT